MNDDYERRAMEHWKASLRQKTRDVEAMEDALKRKEAELVKKAQMLQQRKASFDLLVANKQKELEQREADLAHKAEEVAQEFAETRNKAMEMFREKFAECQERYYQRYQELEETFQANFRTFAEGREAQLQVLEQQYLDKNQDFQHAHAKLVNDFQQQAQEEAAKAASQQAEALLKLQQDFQQQAQSYQQQFAKNLEALESGHQEQLKDAQQHYTDFYLQFQSDLQKRQEELAQRFAEAAAKMEADYAERQGALQQQLQDRLEAVQQSLEERSAQSLKDEADRRQQSWQAHQKQLQDNLELHEAEHQQILEALHEKQAALAEKETELEEQRQQQETEAGTLAMNQRLLAAKEQELQNREDALEDVVSERIEARAASWEAEKDRLEEEIERLRAGKEAAESKALMQSELDGYLSGRSFTEALEAMRRERQEIDTAYQNYQKANDTRVADSDQRYQAALAQLQDMQLKYQDLENKMRDKALEIQQSEETARVAASLQADIENLKQRLQTEIDLKMKYYEDLKMFRAEDVQGREARVAILEMPWVEKAKTQKRFAFEEYKGQEQEIAWLDHIAASCHDFGIEFPKRILYAFHTALKTAEWSPLTVLAGVSGTGKSELPRLYAAFGGMNFLGISVQPNWDSQESMLGFFNSIDNKFDAQPVLRFLVQSQKARTDEAPYGLQDAMNLVLLDEMNLAYVELYFAEFLSKLETRRGRKDDNLPSIDVKLGAGQDPYQLLLGRNVLWSGTMNQDETTKALSDKVLDRSFVINFPRPRHLASRPKLPALQDPTELLTYDIWKDWCSQEVIFSEEEMKPFRQKVEEINDAMGIVGRAIGHRVWQSMEYYMSNYPMAASEDVNVRHDAMNKAFEDQLVQKVMPKLRGIETRGRGKACLETIKGLLSKDTVTDGLCEDFQRGMELGDGQFIWNSAEYLQRDMEVLATEAEHD